MKKLLLLAVFATFGFTFQAAEQKTINQKINKVSLHKKAKINKGVRSGNINKKEEVVLKAQNRNLKRTTKVAVADGVVTKREQTKISRMNNNLNKNIRIAKMYPRLMN